MSELAARSLPLQRRCVLADNICATMEEIVNKLIRSVWSNDDGQDLAEYGLLLALIAVVVAAVIIAFQGAIVAAFNNAIAAF